MIRFTKMQGAGNDYVYVNCFEETVTDPPELARRISDRHFGIGSDGLILIQPSATADFKMTMYNTDGSQGEMCGNAIRCVGKYAYDRRMTDKTVLNIETLGGIRTLWLNIKGSTVDSVRVEMGKPNFAPADIPVIADTSTFIRQPVDVGGVTYEITALSVGNPHAVIFVDNVDALNLPEIGPLFENHPLFPARVNTEFAEVIGEGAIKMRVWERGCGETLACGTGATATLAAAAINGFSGDSARLILRGGELFIEWDRNADKLYMTGPAEFVFDGQIY